MGKYRGAWAARAARDGAFAQIVDRDDKILKLEAENDKLRLDLDVLELEQRLDMVGAVREGAFAHHDKIVKLEAKGV